MGGCLPRRLCTRACVSVVSGSEGCEIEKPWRPSLHHVWGDNGFCRSQVCTWPLKGLAHGLPKVSGICVRSAFIASVAHMAHVHPQPVEGKIF